MHSTSWVETRLATSVIDGAVVRLCAPDFGKYPGTVSGCEATHQVGLWTSDTYRPRGEFRYGRCTSFAPMQTVAYVPAGVSWTANIHDCVRVRPSLYCDFDPAFFRDVTGLEGDDSPQFLEACLSVSTPAMLQALWLLHDEVRNPGFAHAVSVDALCRVVLVEVGRIHG